MENIPGTDKHNMKDDAYLSQIRERDGIGKVF